MVDNDRPAGNIVEENSGAAVFTHGAVTFSASCQYRIHYFFKLFHRNKKYKNFQEIKLKCKNYSTAAVALLPQLVHTYEQSYSSAWRTSLPSLPFALS